MTPALEAGGGNRLELGYAHQFHVSGGTTSRVMMKRAQRECASLSGFFKVVRCVERHTNVNSGSSLWFRINHKRPADQPNSLLHARKTQTSLSPCCFNVESST